MDETANLDIAADRIAWGHNAISGQWCIAPGYVYVHESVADAFIAKLKAAIVKMYGSDPQQSPDFARMISEHDAQRVASYILPDKVVHGGRSDIKARYVEPTVLYPSTWDDPALQQEVFGPVLPVMPYMDLKEIVDIIKRKPKSLAAYIFSKNQATIDYVLGSLSFGGGCVNQTNLHCWIDSLPFGGVGYSGMGKYYGKAGFDAILGEIVDMNLVTRQGGNMRDAAPHLTGSDDTDILKGGGHMLFSCGWSASVSARLRISPEK